MRKGLTLNCNGFTLIEVIVSMLLVGIMAVLAGMGLVVITQGYFFSQQSNETSLKAQVTMARMIKEIGLQDPKAEDYIIKAASDTSIGLTYTDPVAATVVNHTIALSGTEIQIDGITLADKVAAFNLRYYKFDTSGNPQELTPPLAAANLSSIRRVDISFSLHGADNVASTFADTVKVQEPFY